MEIMVIPKKADPRQQRTAMSIRIPQDAKMVRLDTGMLNNIVIVVQSQDNKFKEYCCWQTCPQTKRESYEWATFQNPPVSWNL
jgi:hypothetical protein